MYGAKFTDQPMFTMTEEQLFGAANPTDAIEALLREHKWVCVPRLSRPLTLSRAIRLESGMRLTVHPETELRMSEDCGCCMVRNKTIVSGMQKEIDTNDRDRDIIVEGGIWVSPGRAECINDELPLLNTLAGIGVHLGVMLFEHVERVTVRGLVIREGIDFGIMFADCADFLAEDIRFDGHKKDGIHVNGPAAHGMLSNISGHCLDDIVALNAWDWEASALSFGAIRDIVVRNVRGESEEIRLLPGKKTYRSGESTLCPVEDCLLENISGVYSFKLYQQPNCHNDEREYKDFSEIAGSIKNVRYSHIHFNALVESGFGEIAPCALFEIGADTENLTIENVTADFSAQMLREKRMSVAAVGPKSSTWKRGNPDPEKWSELFNPDMINTADKITFKSISLMGESITEREMLIRDIHLKVNPDYPNTTPKGGTGYGIIGEVVIEP